MKPRRFRFRSTCLFGAPLSYGAPVFAGLAVFLTGLNSDARDILRPNASAAGASPTAAGSGAALTRAATEAARANSRDILQCSGQTLNAMRAMQAAARAAAQGGPDNLGPNLPVVPNGLRPGGLNPAADAATNPANWSGAGQPVETVSGENVNVTIRQTTQQALLQWQTLNVGKKTTLTFDQSAGGENVGQWIAFNRVNDPSGNPTQILGNIKADGQVYLINRNGVIFGGSSQVNARGLTVSSLPINDNLVTQGLLNNRDAQFLFSGLFVPGGADGTPNFTPEPPPASGRYGDVIVQPGAILKSPSSSGGNGGRITLVGANVTQAGTISTESGQTVLAAGLQVAMAANDGSDPSLRGLDVWVGAVGDYAGSVNQSGIIETFTGSTSITGRLIQQLGIIESSTSVNLNGRIDIKASYGAVANPNFDSASEQGAGGPIFFNQYTGPVTLGGGSVTRILPDYASVKAVPGTALPERSQVNIEGLAIHVDKGSIVHAPNGLVSIRAGTWPYKDADGNRTIFDGNGNVESGITNYFSGATQRFLFDAGQIYVDEGATISVAGSVDVFVPLAQSILEVEFRGAELANSPLQRESNLRGAPLTVDIRQSGAFNGIFWVGTPLGDVTGLVGIIERNAAQLTALGGDITLQAGESVVLRNGSTLDVSGGFYSHEGGTVNTSSLLLGGRRVPIKSATPDRVYDGVFSGTSTFTNAKWGITQTFTNPLAPGTNQQAYQEGAGGGSLSLIAPSMAIDGTLRGITVEGPRQRSARTAASSLKITFEADRALPIPGSSAIAFFKHSPTPPSVVFGKGGANITVPEFSLVNDKPVSLPADRLATVFLSPELLDEKGFGSLEVSNPDGAIDMPGNITLSAAPNGSVKFAAANISVFGAVSAPGGTLSFTTYNISPSFATEYSILTPAGTAPFPSPATDRGQFVLGGSARLSTAGLITDDTPESPSAVGEAISSSGGDIAVRSYNASFVRGSVIDVSGGVYVSDRGSKTYGKAGSITLSTGTDPGFAGLIGGTITLDSTLMGYSGSTGGSLSIQANLIEVGGQGNPSALQLAEDFFRNGGFSKYSLTGVGAKSTETPPPGQFESFIPAVAIAANASLRPLAESFIAEKDPAFGGAYTLRRFVNADGLRSPVSLSFTALGSDDPFTLDSLEARGDIVMAAGASIVTEAAANVSFKAGTITLLGSITAPGGQVSIAGAGVFPLTSNQRLAVAQALPTVHLGEAASLSVAGVRQLRPDPYGRRVGSVLGGGSITISGNILAEKGSLLDVSGFSDFLDLSPSVLAGSGNKPLFLLCGINIPPCNTRGVVATRVDSPGGTISLSGSQMLVSDASLRGTAGGQSTVGGSLSVSSGRFYPEGASRTSADTNLVIKQQGDVILDASAPSGVGIGLKDGNGAAYGSLGLFSLERLQEGGFSSLRFGGNIEFQGPINLYVPGALRLASGGVVQADSSVALHSPYIYVGQDFRAPENPNDSFFPFSQEPAIPSSQYFFPPTYGSGRLLLSGNLIDVGTLSLQNIGKTDLVASAGDIRGNGTLSVAGDLTLSASRIYPTSASSFSVFAYDLAGGSGSVSIFASGQSSALPLSAGGNLSIYASSILQSGILRAPLGSITLGWDGTDLDLGDPELDTPFNPIAGSTIAAPIAKNLVLGSGSLTSVSASDENGNAGWSIPFGVSPDGQTWIDPRGVDVTFNGLSAKSVSVSAGDVSMQSGAIVDIRGGGDLIATQWVSGNGGSIDLLGSAAASWAGGTEYESGDLVNFGGETWSARVRHSGQSPTISTYWSKVAESFAIIPASGIAFAPYAAFNTGSNAGLLGGDPGYANSNLKVGDTVTLDGSNGVPAGIYTLLPRRYALFPGAFLLTPVTEGGTGTITKADGAVSVSGYTGNRFNGAAAPPNRARFEIASAQVLANRAKYESYGATGFLGQLASEQGLANPQELPRDAGYAAFQGSTALQLAGLVRSQSSGKGSKVDISSLADIRLVEGGASTGTGVILKTSILNSWNVESLVIGGVRRSEAGVNVLDVRTGSLSLENAGGTLSATDIVLVSKGSLKVGAGASLTATVNPAFTADAFSLRGDGTMIRASSDSGAQTNRTGFTGATTALMEIGAGATITGGAVILDSTFGTRLASNLDLLADTLTLGSGQISVLLDDASGLLPGLVVDPHLVLAGSTRDDAFASRNLTLRSYRSIDVYGTGVLGSANLNQLVLSGSGVRGYEQASGNTILRAGQVTFENSINAVSLAAPVATSGSLTVEAATIRLGANTMAINGYQNLGLNASAGLVVQGNGAFSTNGNLNVRTPLISGEARTNYAITSTQAMVLERSAGTGFSSGALGAGLTLQGATVKANTDILLPSGKLLVRATSGNLEIGGSLSTEGTSKNFGELIRHADAGKITLESLAGDVVLTELGAISVAASPEGGRAGELSIQATQGSFVNTGLFKGSASAGFSSGEFTLDTGAVSASGVGSLASLNAGLDGGRFFDSRSFRIRNGDVAIDHTIRSHRFSLAADQGSLLITGKIDASGSTGGAIALAARNNLTLAGGSALSVAAQVFDSAGKGGSVLLEAGTQRDGAANTAALLDLQAESSIDLSVAEFVPGAYTVVGSSASQGKFTGTLHLRAPRTVANDDFRISPIQSNLIGASSVVAEGYRVYTPVGGILNIALRNQIDIDSRAFLGAAGVGNANEVAMRARLLTGSSASLDSLLVITPGAEIINRTGDLVLGLANNTTAGSTNPEALSTADWDLSSFRYGSKSAAGVLTLRAQGDLVFNNTLSDGFDPIAQGTTQVFTDNGHSVMWLATLKTINAALPVNTQSWSYRLTAGADLDSSDFRSNLTPKILNQLQPGKGSVLVGEFYPAVPNNLSGSGTSAGIGESGQTADTIRISTTTTNRGNRFEVIRTGTGDIAVSAGRDVQLRNQFSTIYTAGVALPNPTSVFSEGDFVSPILPNRVSAHPSQTSPANLGIVQQLYPATWSMAGGNISLAAAANIGRYTLENGVLTVDTTRQVPNNWLYRRGYVDPATGLFASDGGFGTNPNTNNSTNINDPATSTTWWIDYSNFFQGVGTLGGGNIELNAGNDVVNVDAVAPTNARMVGRRKNPDFGVIANAPDYLNIAPNAENLLEHGGGDVAITAGRNIDGGLYYVEKGAGELNAGGEITTNAARTLTTGILNNTASGNPFGWLPTQLYVGKSSFDVTARGNVLLGAVSNTFLLPQGVNNKFWYKTYFNTFSENAGANVISLGGNVTHRTEATAANSSATSNLQESWYSGQNLYDGPGLPFNSSHYQPWLRLSEVDLAKFATVFNLFAPNLRSTALGGDVNLVGDITLAPSATGTLELVAAGGIVGLNQAGPGALVSGEPVNVWVSSTVNVSDAVPESIRTVANPLAYQVVAGRDRSAHLQGTIDILSEVSRSLNETGSFTGEASSQRSKSALHDSRILHSGDPNPVTLYASGGDVTGLTLFTPKKTRVIAGRDISDVSLYLQNVSSIDISLVSAGRDTVPFNEFSELRSQANNTATGNTVSTSNSPKATVLGTTTQANAGDIRISGPGLLEVTSGRKIDLGTGSNFSDGTGTGISSIGNLRNPFLPFGGANIIALAGVTAQNGSSPANGLSNSSLDIAGFIASYMSGAKASDSSYWSLVGADKEFEELTPEQQSIIVLEKFYQVLRDSGRAASETGSYDSGYQAVAAMFGTAGTGSDILTRSREIRTTSGGSISLAAPNGGITMASNIAGNPLTPPGVVTEYGGSISTFTDQDVDLGQARIFTLRGGDIVMWSSNGDIAAGTSPRTVVTAPPTRVVLDISSASVQTDLGGLATGGGIGVLAVVEGVPEGNVDLIAPRGAVDAGDAGIRVTGNLNIAAQTVLNTGNISAGGSTTGASAAAPSAPSISTVTSASNSAAAASSTVTAAEKQQTAPEVKPAEEPLSIITVEVIGYGGASADEEDEEEKSKPQE